MMNRSSAFKIKIDFERSHGSYVFDKNTKRDILDFFGQYATLSLGYNHPVFSTNAYRSEILRLSHQKIVNCEVLSDESGDFDRVFSDFCSAGLFTHFHYCCTGALAIEAAIKTAMDYRRHSDPRIISFKGSFHGINGYGGFVTDRFDPVSQRLNGFPGPFWEALDNPVIEYADGKAVIDGERVEKVLEQIETVLGKGNVCCILIEPIQCTFGDRYFPDSFFTGIRELATRYDTPLVFDEIQVGFGGTGKVWYFQHLPVTPDIVVFGKKTQLSGIMAKEKFSRIFEKAIRLEVTWDADIMDMVRCKHIIRAYRGYGILANVRDMSDRLKTGLSEIDGLLNIRNTGLIVAFDCAGKAERDKLTASLLERGMVCNATRENTVRLRPCLAVTADEVDHAIALIADSMRE